MTPPLAVILPAAGSSTRFGRNKLIEPLGGKPVLVRTIQAFLAHQSVRKIVIATDNKESRQVAARIDDPRITFCAGGATRAQSVQSALQSLPEEFEWVAIHDAAR